MWLQATVSCRVGQQSQDGGEAVELLLHVLRQLLVLLVPETQTGQGSVTSSALQEEKEKGAGDVVLCDPAVWRRVRDGGNSGLHDQLRPVVELDPYLSTCQLVVRKRRRSITNATPLLIPD